MAVVNVFITVDTEVWPLNPNWRAEGLSRDIDRDLYGVTEKGQVGISFQLDLLNSHGLKAVFFIEPFFAEIAGHGVLRKLVREIQSRHQEVQLHLHTEWLSWMSQPLLGSRTGKNIKDFSVDEQTLLVAHGLQSLRNCGAESVCAFRAGSYGANFDTLHALARNGISYDTSYNACYLGDPCEMRTPKPILQPTLLRGVYEFPISFFSDWPGHFRHAQLCACSAEEMQIALLDAWREGWYSFVIVSHSFEMLNRRRSKKRVQRPLPDPIVMRRFEKLCRFLAANGDKFRTIGFTDIQPQPIPAISPHRPLTSTFPKTARRLVEQLARRVT